MKSLLVKGCIFILVISFAQTVSGQQKAIFSQYMFLPSAINPAFAGTDNAFRVTLSARQQWVGYTGAPNTQTFSALTSLKNERTFVGGQLVRDQIGEVLTENNGQAILAQSINLTEKNKFTVGINAGISQLSDSYAELYQQSPLSASDPLFFNQNRTLVNIGWGMLIHSQRWYAGLSSPQFKYLDEKNSAGSKQPCLRSHYFAMAGYVFGQTDAFKIKPNFLFKYVDGAPVQADFNCSVLLQEKFWIGASYRSFDSLNLVMQLTIHQNWQLGYAYDFPVTALSHTTSGTHELMLQMRFPGKNKQILKCYF